MQSFLQNNFPPTVILRHRRENLKKCSLKGLETHPDFQFYTYPKQKLPLLEGYILLTVDAPPLTKEDAAHGLLILDGTWRLAEKMSQNALDQQSLILRSIPSNWKTAYPRRQEDCPMPGQGLASIEAIYAAYHILGRYTDGLLDHYHWKKEFIHSQTFLLF